MFDFIKKIVDKMNDLKSVSLQNWISSIFHNWDSYSQILLNPHTIFCLKHCLVFESKYVLYMKESTPTLHGGQLIYWEVEYMGGAKLLKL